MSNKATAPLMITLVLIGVQVSVFSKTALGHTQTPQSRPLNAWRGLVPLRSTRADVERLLGKPEITLGLGWYLFKGKEAVRFTYAKGDCARDHGWRLPKDTVLSIDVTPHRTVSLDHLELDLTKYEKVESRHPANMFFYTSLEDGLTIRTRVLGGVESVDNIEYGPKTQDIGLSCDAPPTRGVAESRLSKTFMQRSLLTSLLQSR